MTDTDTPDIWGQTDASRAATAAGNSFMVGARNAARSKHRPIGALVGQVPVVNERLAQAVTDSENAHKSGVGVDEAEAALTVALNDARLAREVREGVRDAETGQFTAAAEAAVSFDGGVRAPVGGRPKRRRPWMYEQTSNELFKSMIAASKAEGREREQEHTLVTAGVESTLRHNI